MSLIRGLHHITCIAGDPRANLDFYTRVLGMRLVKRSVNQDDPGTYHLFYGDGEGHPGSDLTFFPWPNLPPGRQGTGLAVEVALAVPTGSLAYWTERLTAAGVAVADPADPTDSAARAPDPTDPAPGRFGERAITFDDPHGLKLALVETADDHEFGPWSASPVAASHQVRRMHSARMCVRDLEATADFLIHAMGFQAQLEEDGWHRFSVAGGGSGRFVDVQAQPDARLGSWGLGSVHHIAWRVADLEAQREARARVEAAGRHPTEVIDRFWFRSVYFREPGGVLFELATDGPGFSVDEDPDALGERLILPPWLEPRRREIEAVLPALG